MLVRMVASLTMIAGGPFATASAAACDFYAADDVYYILRCYCCNVFPGEDYYKQTLGLIPLYFRFEAEFFSGRQ